MRVDRSYCSNQNTWSENHPQCIVVHNTDNFAAGADARAHARAQYQGNFQIMSAHYYVDDGEIAYQAAPHSRGCWHVGRNYGSKNLFGRYGNRNSIAVEMCVQKSTKSNRRYYRIRMQPHPNFRTASRLRCACRKDMITKPHFYIRWSW